MTMEPGPGGRRLGDVLVGWGVLTPAELQHYLEVQKRLPASNRRRLGQILLQEDRITEVMLAQALAEASGLSFTDLTQEMPDPRVARLIPMALANRAGIIPLSVRNGTLRLAVADPVDVVALDDAGLRLRGQEGISNVDVVVAAESQVRRRIAAAWSEATAALALENVGSIALDDAGAVTAVDQILRAAVRLGASDIHIEPMPDQVRVRMRVDGSLRRIMSLPATGQGALISRMKILADLDISKKRVPQDGRARLAVDGLDLNMRVSTLPTLHGETVVVRLLTDVGDLPALSALGLPPSGLAHLRTALLGSQGLVLITGPTGSGKTTTLYSAIHEVVAGDRNIVALEDPVEIELPGVSQVQISEASGLTFAAGLRSVLRQDPDIIMVGEIRDVVTAELAIRAALTGHLVLATVHTVDAPSAVLRLADMGIPRYLIAASLRLVIAQRLLRRPCPDCLRPEAPDDDTISRLDLTAEQAGHMVVGAGCERCEGLGVRGRTGVFEVLPVTQAVRVALTAGGDEAAVAHAARPAGWQSLREAGVIAAVAGRTSVSEVLALMTTAD